MYQTREAEGVTTALYLVPLAPRIELVDVVIPSSLFFKLQRAVEIRSAGTSRRSTPRSALPSELPSALSPKRASKIDRS